MNTTGPTVTSSSHLLPTSAVTRFTSICQAYGFVESKYTEFENGRNIYQYIALTNISEQDFRDLDHFREMERCWKSMRFSFFAEEDVLIIKLGCSRHEIIKGLLIDVIHRSVMAVGITWHKLRCRGAATVQMPRGVSKDPDSSWSPDTRRMGEFPSFIVDIGVSESSTRLRQDAQLWLTNTNGQTRLVLLVHLDYSQRTLTVERWQMVNTQSNAEPVPGQVQQVVVRSPDTLNLAVEGSPLILPLSLIFDTVPNLTPTPDLDEDNALSLPAEEFHTLAQILAEEHLLVG